MQRQESKARYYIMMITSVLMFSTLGICRRYVPGVSSSVLAFLRGIIGGLFLILFVLISGKKLDRNIGKSNFIKLIVSGVFIGFNWMLLFEAYVYTTIPVATLCYYMQPTILILLSPIVFGERLPLKKLICAILAVVGMVLVSGILENKATGTADILGIALGLGAAVCYAIVVMINKKTEVKDDYTKTIVQLLSGGIALIPYILLTGGANVISLNALSIVLILVMGIVHTGIGFALYFGSMRGLKTQTIAILSYVDPIGALILSALVLGESMSVLGIIGAVLIIGSALVSELKLTSLR